jgi:hypothetical protein
VEAASALFAASVGGGAPLKKSRLAAYLQPEPMPAPPQDLSDQLGTPERSRCGVKQAGLMPLRAPIDRGEPRHVVVSHERALPSRVMRTTTTPARTCTGARRRDFLLGLRRDRPAGAQAQRWCSRHGCTDGGSRQAGPRDQVHTKWLRYTRCTGAWRLAADGEGRRPAGHCSGVPPLAVQAPCCLPAPHSSCAV